VFFDMGNFGRNVADYGLSDLHYAIGAGLGYGLPIGPIRFDAAWNPDRDPGDEAWVLHLTVGHPF
jgi:outer membrane translocation and assembly module TamA